MSDRPQERALHDHARFVGISAVVTPVLTFGISVVIARTLGPEGRGAYGVVVATVAVLPALISFGFEYAVCYWTAAGQVDRGSILKTATSLALVVGGICASIVVICAATEYPDWLIPPGLAGIGIACFAGIIFVAALRSYWTNYLMGLERYGYSTFGTNLATALQLAVLTFFWLRDAVTLNTVLIAFAVHGAVSFVLFFVLAGREFLRAIPAPFIARPEVSGMFQYGGWQYLSAILVQANLRLNIFVLAALGGAHETGLYTAALGPAAFLWMLSAPLTSILTARTARRADDSAFPDRVAGALRLVFMITAPTAVASGLAAPTLLPLVFGELFREAVAVFWILIPGTIAYSVVRVVSTYMSGAKRPKWNAAIDATGAIVTVSLSVVLVPQFGALGAAVATSTALGCSFVVAITGFVRVSRLSPRRLVTFQLTDWAPAARVLRVKLGRGFST